MRSRGRVRWGVRRERQSSGVGGEFLLLLRKWEDRVEEIVDWREERDSGDGEDR